MSGYVYTFDSHPLSCCPFKFSTITATNEATASNENSCSPKAVRAAATHAINPIRSYSELAPKAE